MSYLPQGENNESSNEEHRGQIPSAYGTYQYAPAAGRQGYLQGSSSSSFPFAGQAPLSDSDTSRLWDSALGDEQHAPQYLGFFNPPTRMNPMGLGTATDLSTQPSVLPGGWSNQNSNLPNQYSDNYGQPHLDSGGSGAVSTSHMSANTTSRQQKQDFVCGTCGTTYDRRSRARDCQYQDLGMAPYQCRGTCGDIWCLAAYGSEECLRRHLSPSVQCSLCHKQISKQNAARHREVHCPNRPR